MAEINEYEALLNQNLESEKSQLKGNFFANEDVQPDRRAEALKIAEKMKVPVDFAEKNLEEFKKKANQTSDNEYEDIIKNYPGTAEFLKDATNTGLAQDSIDELKNIESKTNDGFWSDLKDSFTYGSLEAVKGTIGYGRLLQAQGALDRQKEIAENPALKNVYGQFSDPLFSDKELVGFQDKITKIQEKYKDEDAQKSIISSALNGDISGASKALTLQIVQNLPQLVVTAINAPIGLSSMFISESGSKFGENVEAGVDQQKAVTNALATGAISTGIESLTGIGKINPLKQVIKESVEKIGSQTTKQILKKSVLDISKTAGGEGVEEFATTWSQDLLDWSMDIKEFDFKDTLSRSGDAFLVGAGSGGLVGSVQVSAENIPAINKRFSESVKAQFNSDTYDKIGEAAKDSKLRKRSSDKFSEFVDKATKGTPFETVFIKAESLREYFQKNNLSPEEELGKLGLLESYEKAVATTGELSIPASEWINKTVDSDLYKAVKDDIKYNPDDSTVNELKLQSKEIKEELKKQSDAVKKAEAEGKEIIDDVYTQLVDSGTPKSEAKQQAAIYRAFNILADRAGISPIELYNKYGLKIIGQDQMVTQEQEATYFPMPEVAQGIINLQKNENGAYDYDPDVLNQIRNSINQGELIKTQPKVDENGEVIGVLGGASTYPDFFQNKGYTKKLVLGIIDKFNSGRQLTERQIDILNDLYEGAADKINRGEYFQKNLKNMPKEKKSKVREFFQWQSLEKHNKSIIKSKEFKEWFKGSKASWDDKSPRKFFHGSSRVFDKFDKKKSLTPGIVGFFTADERFAANDYAVGESGNIKPVYLSIKNPFIGSENLDIAKEFFNNNGSKYYSNESEYLKSIENGFWETLEEPDFVEFLKSKGFDAIQTGEKGYLNYGVFNNNQIMSAITGEYLQDIKGSFNPDTNVIKLFKSKDQSTFLHESAHLFLNVMNDLAVNNPTESILKDIQTIKEWVGTDDLMSVEAQEKWARGFESYLMTGETPSPALRKAFNTFKVWLTRIYKNVQGLSRAAGFDVSITPEIKGVMDRLLATEEEINAAEAELNMQPLFKNLDGLTDKESEKYKNLMEESRLYAEAKLNKKLIDELNRKQRKEYKEKFKQYYDDALNALKENPIYKSIESMKSQDIKLDYSSIEKSMGKEIAELIPNRLISKSVGVDYNIVADMFGIQPEQFVKDIAESPTIEQAAKLRAEELIKIDYPEIYKEPEIKDEAKAAIHNEKRSELLKFELEYLANKAGYRSAIKKIASRASISQEVKDQAAKFVSNVKVKDLKPYLYLRAERKFAKEAANSLAKGDLKAAFEAKRKEYFNYEIYRATVEAQDNVDKTVKNYRKIFKKTEDVAKSRDMDLVNAAREILSRYGISRGNDVDPASYLESMRKDDEAQYESIVAIINGAVEGAGDYQNISYDKFIEMKNTVDALWSLSRENKIIEIDGKSVELKKAADDLINQTMVHLNGEIPGKIKQDLSDIEKFKVKLLGAKATLVRAEAWTDLMDLGDPTGVFKKYVWNPVSESITKYRLKKKEVINEYKKIVDEYKDIFTDKPIIGEEIGGFVFKQKSNLLMALLHTGNESNKSKLLRGRGWGTVNEDGTLNSTDFDNMMLRFQEDGTLTARDYEFAQKIWGLMESLKPEAQKAHKKMFGYYFNEITAKEIVTKFGTYSGGYIPAKVDLYTNEDAAIRKERESLEKNNNSFQFPTTGRGFTKGRVDSYAAPLDLNINLLGSHIDGVLRFSVIEPTIKQVSRLVMNKEFRNVLSEVDPQIAREMLVPWLQRSAQQKVVLPSETGIGKLLDGFATVLRTNVAMQFMVGNVTNAAQQLTGVIVSATKIKPRHLSVAMFNYLTNYKSSLKSIYEKSAWMSANQDSNVYEIQGAIDKVLVNPSVFENIKDFSKAHTYFLQSFTQNIVNSIVWMGAYNQAIENNLSEVESVRFADSAVRTTQGTTNAEDISRYEVGTATQRLFTQFAGYFNMLANLNASEIQKISKTVGLKKGMGKLFYVYMMGFAAPAFLSELIIQAGRGGFDDEDDDGYIDDMLAAFFGSQAKTATALVPYAGNVANSVIGRFNNVAYDDRLTFSPVLSVLESVSGVPSALIKDLGSEEIKKRTVKDSLMLLGVISGLPLAPIGKPVGYVMDVESGKANPSSPIDYGRGLITGQPGKN